MKKFDWTSTISINLHVLHFIGLWPEKQLYEFNFYTVFAIFNAVFFIGLPNLTQIINIFIIYNDLEALTATFFILTTSMLGITKMCFFIRNLKEVRQLFVTLNSEQFQPKSEHQLSLIKPTLRSWKVSYFVFIGMVYMTVTQWVLTPLLGDGHQLLFLSWLPFSTEKSPYYQIVFVYQVVYFCYFTAANINLDTLTYALLMYICAQCDILCDDLSNLQEDESSFEVKFVSCVQHHKEIVRFAKKTNRLFNMIILGQMGTSTMALALTMFQLSLVDTLNEAAIGQVFYIVGLAIQLFLYCWFGGEIEIKSSKIQLALYKCDWINQSPSAKKSILIFNERCQRSIKITAINLFDLSLNTFVTILRSAWSYFAVLYKVNSN